MKTTVALVLIAVILLCVAGCGPGQPFEVANLDTPQPAVTAQLASAPAQ